MAAGNRVIKNYLGGKGASGVYQFICNNIPRHNIYIEGFIGGGTILQTKTPVARNIGFEVDKNVYTTWQDRSKEFNLEIINESFLTHWAVIAKKLPLGLCFVYLDPPYVHSTRSSSHRYNHEMTIDDHRELLSLIRTVKTNYMISCYDNELYTEELKDWRKLTTQAMTRGGIRTETIYMNYAAGNIGDSIFVGSDFTDRQRIKRKIERHINRLKHLSAAERTAIIEAIKREFPNNI